MALRKVMLPTEKNNLVKKLKMKPSKLWNETHI